MQEALNIIIQLIPTIFGVIGVLISIIACIFKVKGLTDTCEKENQELKAKLSQVIAQNSLVSKHSEEIQEIMEDIANKYNEIYIANANEMEKIFEIKAQIEKDNQVLQDLTKQIKNLIKQNTVNMKEGK